MYIHLPEFMAKRLPRAAIAWGLLLLMMIATKPAHVPVVLLVIPFIVLYAALYNTLLLGASWRQHLRGNTDGSEYRQPSAVASLFIVLLLVIDSLGQLTVRDVLTLVLIFVVTYFYLVRMRKSQQ